MKKLDVRLEMLCPVCYDYHYVNLNKNDLQRWEEGELAQKAFPYLSATEREQVISRICPKCQEKIFGAFED